MTHYRTFDASVAGLIPDLPEDVHAVSDRFGLRWNRIGHPSPLVNGFVPDDPFADPKLPKILSWHQLIRSRATLAECTPVQEPISYE